MTTRDFRGWRLARVQGRSMLPTLRPGDVVLAWWGAPIASGRIVIAQLPHGRPLGIKRAAWSTNVTLPAEEDTSVFTASEPAWWLECDNPAQGNDSWLYGAVPATEIQAVVVARIWPRPCRL